MTVRVAWPLLVSLVAVMIAVPGATDVTNPLDETVATPGLSEAQAMDRPDNGFPPASNVVAVACVVWPATTEEAARETLTDATGSWVTVTVAVACFVSLTAEMVATPRETADTSPLAETVATPGASVLQSIVRPVSTLL